MRCTVFHRLQIIFMSKGGRAGKSNLSGEKETKRWTYEKA